MPIITRIKNFKYEFGNPLHLQIRDKLEALNKDILEHEKNPTPGLATKIAEQKAAIKYLIKLDKSSARG